MLVDRQPRQRQMRRNRRRRGMKRRQRDCPWMNRPSARRIEYLIRQRARRVDSPLMVCTRSTTLRGIVLLHCQSVATGQGRSMSEKEHSNSRRMVMSHTSLIIASDADRNTFRLSSRRACQTWAQTPVRILVVVVDRALANTTNSQPRPSHRHWSAARLRRQITTPLAAA